MNNKTLGTALLAAGVILLLASLTADVLGFGTDPAAFGIRQIVGTVLGVVAVAVGFFLRSKA